MKKKMRPLTKRMWEVLQELAQRGNFAHYMPYMGRFNPNPYYFLHDSMKTCTREIKGLLGRGLVEEFDALKYHVRISQAGRKFLKQNQGNRFLPIKESAT